METRDKEDALKAIREQRLPPSEQARQSEEFNPGVNPERDHFGTPAEPEEDYYPAEEGRREKPLPHPPPGATDADVKDGITVEDLDRSVRPGEEPPRR